MRGRTPGGVLLVTGTGTDVGKTVATAALAALARARGLAVAIVKPVQTGVHDGDPDDADTAVRLATPPTGPRLTARTLLRLEEPLAPDIAARRAGVCLPAVTTHAPAIHALREGHDLVLVEGAGGLLVRLDSQGGTLSDLGGALPGAGLVVVVAAGLGTLNHTELTVEAARRRGMEPAGLIVGSWPAHPGTPERENLVALPRITGVPLWGAIPQGAGALRATDFSADADGWLAAMPRAGLFGSRSPDRPGTRAAEVPPRGASGRERDRL